MKSRVLMGIMLACALLALPAAGQQFQGSGQPAAIDATTITPAEVAAMSRLQTAYPGTLTHREGSQLSRVYGRTFEMGDTPGQTADRFLGNNADVFGAEAADLVPTTRILPSGNTTGLMYDPDTDSYKFTLVYYSQYRDGIPVFRSDVRLMVKNEAGYPLVWVGSNLRRLGDFHPDTTLKSVVDPTVVAPGMTSFTAMEPVIWAGIDDVSVLPHLAVTFRATNDGSGSPVPNKWLYVVDSATGEVLYKENLIVFTNITGSVKGKATSIPKSDTCNPEVDTIFPYAKVSVGSTTAYTNSSGNFTLTNPGTTAVTVTSYMDGQYFNMNTAAGSIDTMTMSVTPPGPANFIHNSANTSEYVRAQTNAYVQANKVRSWVLTYKPDYPTIATETGFPLYVNRSDGYCPGNAWYDPTEISMNFCRAASIYPNTAYSNVIHHEYGHHLCDMGGTGQGQYGEGVGDAVAVCLCDDPILGYGFEGDCNAGIRTADNTMQYPCGSDIHTCAQLLSGCIWSTRNALQPSFPSTYLTILSNLMVNSIPLHSGSSTINPAICIDWITLDGGVTGAHYAQIVTGFGAHSMTPSPPPTNDMCSAAIKACPGTAYTGNTTYAFQDGTTSCGTSSTSHDVWYKYRPATSGTATFSLCSGTNYDSVLSLHAGCPGDVSNTLACDDNSCGGTASTIQNYSVTANTLYLIRVSGKNGAYGNYSLSITGPACAPAESTPPSPNPMTFDVAPAPAGTTSISMTATSATDAASMPVEYFFKFVSGGTGGTDSSWQSSATYTDSGLLANTVYTYKVKARDTADTPNETSYSADASTATMIQTPNSVTIGTTTVDSIALTAAGFLTNLTVGSSGLYFDSTTPGGNASLNTWVQTTATTATSLSANTNYVFRVKGRNQNSVETPYCPTNNKTTLIETPTGVSFGAVTDTTVELIATGPLTNLAVGTSGVYFNSTTSGGNGGINAWVQSPSDIATGLSPNTSYAFQVKARNQNNVETAYTTAVSVVTAPILPAAPTVSAASATSANVDVNANGNPASIEFAIRCTTNPTDASWDGMYVTAAGGASATPVWRTEAAWGTVVVQGLKACTSYTFAVKARNSALVETAFGAGASVSTAGQSGDMDDNGVVNGFDIQPYINCVIEGGPGCDCANSSVEAFVSCLLDAGTCQ